MSEGDEERLRSIGQMLEALKPDFPSVTISKIRFLEAEGLISPHRAPSGYRRYSRADEERLRYILRAQSEHYLPLKVIARHLEMIDRGLEPRLADPTPQAPEPADRTELAPPARTEARRTNRAVRLTRSELLASSGLSEAALAELEGLQIVTARAGGFYGREALTIAQAARRLAELGIDARHLRAIKVSADREVGLVEQAIAPYLRRSGGGRELAGDVLELVIGVHVALARSALER